MVGHRGGTKKALNRLKVKCLISLGRPTGFEPATYGFVVLILIQIYLLLQGIMCRHPLLCSDQISYFPQNRYGL
jgi:hypothetical protein